MITGTIMAIRMNRTIMGILTEGIRMGATGIAMRLPISIRRS